MLQQRLAQGNAAATRSDTHADQAESLPTRISWSGRGRCYDNILVERFWRTLKYEEVFLRAYEDPLEAFHCLDAFIDRYNHHRPHQALGYRTPYEVYTQVPDVQPVLS